MITDEQLVNLVDFLGGTELQPTKYNGTRNELVMIRRFTIPAWSRSSYPIYLLRGRTVDWNFIMFVKSFIEKQHDSDDTRPTVVISTSLIRIGAIDERIIDGDDPKEIFYKALFQYIDSKKAG